ncbi:MAG: phosphate ABC transporter permease subunit PstC [Candidatus Odinarchaeota archaeon]
MSSETIFENDLYIFDENYSYLRKNRDPMIKWILFFIASIATIFVFLIIIFLFVIGGPFFAEVSLAEFLLGTNWLPSNGEFGALPIVVDTLLVTFGAIVIALPLGLMTSIFIAELAPPKLRKVLKFSIEILAGIPSIVFGFFGLVVLNIFIRDIFGLHHGNTWLSGSLILAIMALPIIVSVCEDSIRAVPDYYREASYAMGATKWQTMRKVVVPAGISGITAALVLGIGRALGETMAMMLVIGNCKIFPEPITNMFSCVAVITSTIGLGLGPTETNSIEWRSYFALGIILFIMTLMVNTIANVILSKIQRKFTGEKTKEKHVKLKETKFYNYILKFRLFLITLLISIVIAIILPDMVSKVVGVLICVGMGLTFQLYKIVPKNKKKWILYGVALLFIGWVLSTWIGIFLTILFLALIIGVKLIFKRISTVSQEKFWIIIVYICSSFAVISVGVLLYYIIARGLPVIFRPNFLAGSSMEGGILPAITGTIQLTLGSIAFALPLGMCVGIYLSEYAGDNKITKIIRSGIDNLNGTPSIVFALFGVAIFLVAFGLQKSLIAGVLTLGLMILPTIIRTTEEAVKAIPKSFREGSLALGSSKWQGISKIVLPAALPGIVTGAVLGMGRSAGETAPIMFTAVRTSSRYLITMSLFEPVMALTYHLYRLLTEALFSVEEAAGTALTLLLLILVLYGVAFLIRSRYEKRKQW